MKNLKRSNYKLLDCGEYEKLEQIGNSLFRRPAPQATWKRKLDADIWQNYSAVFDLQDNKWITSQEFNLPHFQFENLNFELRFSAKGQIGIFPEQSANWQWLRNVISKANRPLSILNGFAYTGGSTLFSSTAETTVTHIDSSSSSIKWAQQNCRLSGLEGNKIRWIVDDIITFLTREVKRGTRYDGIILDPPAFGRGKKSATWKLDRDLPKLMQLVGQLLSKNPEFVILSCHDQNFGKTELRYELANLPDMNNGNIETLDLTINSETGNNLPAGKCARWRKES